MPRIRTIKPDFFTSLTIADLPLTARLTFIGLWTHADDEGRCKADGRLIKAAIWPLDDRTAADVMGDVQLLIESSLITHYTVNERSFLAVSGWGEHQRINRPTKSAIPAPQSGSSTPLTCGNVPISEDSVSDHGALTDDSLWEGKGKEGKGREGSTQPRTRGTRIPDDFAVTPDMRQWVAEKKYALNLDAVTEEFVDYWRGVPGQKGVKLDWEGTWRNWVRRKSEDVPRRGGRAARTANDQRPEGW